MDLVPPPFSLRQLQYVVAVQDARNFRRAAEACRVSQPSLSAQIASLESALGVRLFERSRRRVLPTAAGTEVAARARRILVEAGDLVEASRRLVDPLCGTLRIGVLPTISPYLLPEAAPRLRSRFARLTVQWTEDRTERLVASLGAGKLDAALLALEAPIGDLEREVVARDAFVLAAPPGHRLAAKRGPVRADALHGEDVLLLDDGHCLRDQALAVCGESREVGYRATSLATLSQMVAGGAGVTLLPRLALPTEVRRGEIVVRRFAAPAPARTIALVWRRGSPAGPALREVAGAIRDAYARLEPRIERTLGR